MATAINRIYHDIQLNFGSSDVKRTVIKQSSELTHILRIRLYDNTGEITINPAWNFMISAIKADNTHILNQLNISIVDNAIEITMTKQMLASPGTMRCEIAIQDSSKKALYSDTFFIYVDPNVQDGSYIESTDEFDSIVQAMDKVNKMKDHVEEVKDHVDDMAESIEETYEELKDAVDTTQGLIKENEKINEAEKTREANENTRKTNEQQRQSNEQQRQDNTSAAIKNAEAATKNANGAAADVQEKLKSLESQTYTHPDSGVTPGTYKSVTVDKQGHVTSGTNPTTLLGYGITDAANSSHTHGNATTSADGFMSKSDKSKLNGIAASSTTPMAPASTASVGKENAYARGDHVHPLPSKLSNARLLRTNLKETKAVTFDGSDDQLNIPVTGILNVANGGTGQTSLYASIGALLHALNDKAFLDDKRTIPDDYRIPILTGTNWNTMNFSYVSKRFLKVEDSTVHVNIANNRGTYLTKNKCMFGFAIVYSSGCSALCGSASSVIYLEGGTSPAGYTLEANYGSSSLANKKFVKIIGFYY